MIKKIRNDSIFKKPSPAKTVKSKKFQKVLMNKIKIIKIFIYFLL